jgi:hypothetical protein
MSRKRGTQPKKRRNKQSAAPRQGAAPLPTLIAFRFGDVLPPDDPLAEWVATLALAFNDISYVHTKFDEAFAGRAYEYLYVLRIALSHFKEAAEFLDKTSDAPFVIEFVKTLPQAARDRYEDSLRRYREQESRLAQIRNLAAFHYPELKVVAGQKRLREVQRVLTELEDERGFIFKAASGTVGESRMLFADDIAGRLFVRGADDNDLYAAHEEVKQAIESFMRFTNAALDEWWARVQAKGAVFTKTPGRPASLAERLAEYESDDVQDTSGARRITDRRRTL